MNLMKKLLKTSDKILISLAFLGDLVIEVYSRGHGFKGNKGFLESLKLENSTLRSALSRSLKTGDIEKVVGKDGHAYYKLTSPGKGKVKRIFPLYKLSEKTWDKKWRIVVFDINDKEKSKRESLRRKLLSLGFGKLQESVYISPLDVLFDLGEFLKEHELYGQAIVFEAKEIFSKEPSVIANFVWSLKKINEEYGKWLEKIDEVDLDNPDQQVSQEIKDEFFQIVLKDPNLPKEFLPKYWLGEEVRRKFVAFSSAIATQNATFRQNS